MDNLDDLIDVIMRQTNYDRNTAHLKLGHHNNDIVAVIREYMDPPVTENSTIPTSTNQKIYYEIRNHMDIMKH